MEKNFKRLFFYLSDLRRISGKSERTCSKVIREMRNYFNLGTHQTLTVFHVSEFLDIPLEKLRPYIL